MDFSRIIADPIFLPTVRVVVLLFGLGLGLVLFFARRDLHAGLRGELGQRYLSWLILAPLFLLATFSGGLIAAGVLLVVFYRLLAEYVRVVGVTRPYAGLLVGLVPVTVAVAARAPELYSALPAGMILLLTLVPLLSGRKEELYTQLTLAGRGYLYVVWSVGHLILLRSVAGVGMVLVVGIGVALTDIMQYTVGKLLGRHLISPEIHPRKAWEGLLGDLLGATLAVTLLGFALPVGYGWPIRIGLILVLAIGAAWGDLVSSLIKRVAGVKDWGRLLPGHGGLLDRANSLVVAVPLVYYFVLLVGG